jgi:hypothetical protein
VGSPRKMSGCSRCFRSMGCHSNGTCESTRIRALACWRRDWKHCANNLERRRAHRQSSSARST